MDEEEEEAVLMTLFQLLLPTAAPWKAWDWLVENGSYSGLHQQ